MSSRRVVITGMGWVTPLGHDVDAAWARCLAGETGIGPVTRYDASTFATNFAAEVKGFDLARFIPSTQPHRHAGVGTQFALAAAMNAWKQAGLHRFAAFDGRRMGIYMGAGEGSLAFDAFISTNLAGWVAAEKKVNGAAWAKAGHERMTSDEEIEQEPFMTLAHVAAEFGCRGPSFNCMTACAASTQAIGEASEIIKRGDADLMFSGGAHSMIHPLGMTGFIRLTAMSDQREDPQRASRPFDKNRSGFVMGEGAGVLVLEELSHALARGANPLAEIAGFGSSADAFRITDIQSDGKGAIAAMREACRQAGIDPRETDDKGRPGVHYISAHGTGTQENDRIESIAVKGLFGGIAPRVPFSSVKSMFGHLIQAAGAVELITCIKAIETGWLPPTINLTTPDPECDLDYVPNKTRDLRAQGGVDVCLSNSFGFGGQNDTICVKRFA